MSGVINLTGNNEYNSNRNLTQKNKKNRRKKNIIDFTGSLAHMPIKPGEYYIPEIDIKLYYYSTRRLFKLIENDLKDYGTYDDIFAKRIFFAQTSANESGWRAFETQRKFQQALSSRLGDFHEELAGKLPGYRTLPQNHWSGLDVMKEDRSEIYEWKNRADVSTDVLTTIYQKFKKILDSGKIGSCILVHVNVPDGWKPPAPIKRRQDGTVLIDLTTPKYAGKVHIISGREAYAHMSGKPDFMNRLLMTMSNTFQDVSLQESLSRISSTMDEA